MMHTFLNRWMISPKGSKICIDFVSISLFCCGEHTAMAPFRAVFVVVHSV